MDCWKCGLKSTQVHSCGDCGCVECGDCRTDGLCSMCVMNWLIVQSPAVQSMIKRAIDTALSRAKSPIVSDHIVSAQSSSETPVTSINGASNDQSSICIETPAISNESKRISDQRHNSRTPIRLSSKPEASEQVNWTTPVVLPWYVRIGGNPLSYSLSAGLTYPKSRRRGKRRRRRQTKNELAVRPTDNQHLSSACVVPRYVWHSDQEGDYIVEQRHRYQSTSRNELKVPVRLPCNDNKPQPAARRRNAEPHTDECQVSGAFESMIGGDKGSCDVHDGSGAGPERSPTLCSQGERTFVKPDVLGTSYKNLSMAGEHGETDSDVQDEVGASNEWLPTSCDNNLESVDQIVLGRSNECSTTFCDRDELESVDLGVLELSHECSSTLNDYDEMVSEAWDVSVASNLCLSTTRPNLENWRSLRGEMIMCTSGRRGSRAGVAVPIGPVQSTWRWRRYAWDPGEEDTVKRLFGGAHNRNADLRGTVVKEDLQPGMSCVEKSSRCWLPSVISRSHLGVTTGVVGHCQGLDGRKVSYSCAFDIEGTCNNNFLFPLACGDDLFRATGFDVVDSDPNGWWQRHLHDHELMKQGVIAPYIQPPTKDGNASHEPECTRTTGWRIEDTAEFDPGGLGAIAMSSTITNDTTMVQDMNTVKSHCPIAAAGVGDRTTGKIYETSNCSSSEELGNSGRGPHEEEDDWKLSRVGWKIVKQHWKQDKERQEFDIGVYHEEEHDCLEGQRWIKLLFLGCERDVTVDKWIHNLKTRILIDRRIIYERVSLESSCSNFFGSVDSCYGLQLYGYVCELSGKAIMELLDLYRKRHGLGYFNLIIGKKTLQGNDYDLATLYEEELILHEGQIAIRIGIEYHEKITVTNVNDEIRIRSSVSVRGRIVACNWRCVAYNWRYLFFGRNSRNWNFKKSICNNWKGLKLEEHDRSLFELNRRRFEAGRNMRMISDLGVMNVDLKDCRYVVENQDSNEGVLHKLVVGLKKVVSLNGKNTTKQGGGRVAHHRRQGVG